MRSGLALLGACLIAQVSLAEEASEPNWIPSLDLGFSTYDYSADATVENFVDPPRHEDTINDPSRQLQFKIGAGLMGPMIEGVRGHPRLFIQGGFQFAPFSSDKIFKTGELRGDPELEISKFTIARNIQISRGCLTRDPPNCPARAPENFEGQGSEIDAKIDSPAWYAALGLAFQVPMGEVWLLQVRPSVAYSVEKVEMSGRLRTVIETDPVNEVFEVHQSSVQGAAVIDHHLGFGLELAFSMFRRDLPIRTWLYADAQFMWLLNDPTTHFADSSGVAAYTVERDGFGIRGGAGFRFSWMGFGAR